MSGILGVFRPEDRGAPDPAVDLMLEALRRRGKNRCEVWHSEGATLAVARYSWELEPDFSGPVLLVIEPDLVVAADASIYYRIELGNRLKAAGYEPAGSSPSQLIAAAYRAWGDRCVEHIEGEFAFIVWDRHRRRALCSRDFLGNRPLHYSDRGSTLVVGSTIGAVIAHPEVPRDLDLASLGAAAAGFHAAGPETCYASVRIIPAGSSLTWREGTVAGPARHWEPEVEPDSPLSFREAAEELRHLLTAAVRERMAPAGVSTVWMSGGWDSPAVFAAAQALLQSDRSGRQLLPISISYPEGDPGREDELIEAIASRWKTPIRWLHIAEIPYFPPQPESAAPDEPYRHPFEFWNRALALGTRVAGSRVALDGNGGDQIFQVSPLYLADLFRAGRWLALARDWRALGAAGFRTLFSLAIQPNLPPAMLRAAARVRGRRLPVVGERWTPTWFREEFLRRFRLGERDLACLPDPRIPGRARAESEWYWKSAFLQRAISQLGSFALEEGVELRSPLADRRIVEFALRRPREERATGAETKLLLRKAMQGLLPPEVLATRTRRTGTTDGFAHREMSRHLPARLASLLEQPVVLEELGIIDTTALRRAAASYRHPAQADLRVALWSTYQAEWWLRTRYNSALDTASEGRLLASV